MSFENPTPNSKKDPAPGIRLEIEPGYEEIVPEEFRQDPLKYFESHGKSIKSGKIKRDETGRISEDPTAVKEFPVWTSVGGQELQTVGKRINIEKGKVGESGDPFYEYKIMELVKSVGLPAPCPIVKVEQQGTHLIVMEKVQGIGWYEKDTLRLKERGYTDDDIENLKRQVETMMMELRQRFEEAGIVRGWKLKDMIFNIDIDAKRIREVVPTDWERTKIDPERLRAYKEKSKMK